MNVWGNKGKEWLRHLPNIITQLSIHWQLTEITPVDNLSYNYVATAKAHHNTPVVLKFGCDKTLIENEYHALKQWDGSGAIRVIDRCAHHNALLLEQAIPGTLLKENYLNHIEDSIYIYANVVKKLSSLPKPNTHDRHAYTWCATIDNIDDMRIKTEYIDKAKELRDYLLSSSVHETLCHGDLHLENIIHHNNNWLAIDPKGILGELAFEAAAFDLLNTSDWDEPKNLTNKVNYRLSLLANSLEISKDRLLAWIFLRVLISIQWFIEDKGDPTEKLRLASVLYPMLSK